MMDNGSSIHIIAEAGTNHNGSENEARQLIEIAARAKADSVKFQIINPWGLYLPGEYEYGHYDIKEVLALRHQTQLDDETYRRLASHAHDQGVPFSASIFDKEGLELLTSLNPPYIKIASGDLNNLRFLRQVAETDIRMILSTGMSSLSDIELAVTAIRQVRELDKVVLMHCVSVYPAQTEETNLRFLETLDSEFGTELGFSDHTGTSIAAIAAISLGVKWFEKHFTRDKSQKGLDHAYAMEESGLFRYVEDIRKAEAALKAKKEKVSEGEVYTRRRARRALYAARDLKPGTVVEDKDVLCVRPEGPMGAHEIDEVIGKVLKVEVKQHQAFDRTCFQ